MNPAPPESATEDSYPPKPPLWTPTAKPKGTPWSLVVIVGAFIIGVLAVALGLDSHFMTSPATPLEVTVLARTGVSPDDEGPPLYRYTVTLPDGVEARYSTTEAHHPGERLALLYSRSRLTGRIYLTEPRARRDSPK